MRPLPRNGIYIPPAEGVPVSLWIKDILAGALAVVLAVVLTFFVIVFK